MPKKLKIVAYFIARSIGLFAAARRLTANFPRILCYHGGCLEDEWSYNGLLFMRRATFSKRIEWLQNQGYRLVTLDVALRDAGKNSSNRPLVVLTFDDGWYSTGSELFPVLSEKKIPSLLYLSTKQFQEGGPVVPVALGYLLWKAEKRVVNIAGVDEEIDGGYDIRISTERNRLIRNVASFVSKNIRTSNEISFLLHSIAESVGVSPKSLLLESRRFSYLNGEEVKRLAESGCAIESHGHVHRYPKGESSKFEEDLRQCSQVIQDLKLPTPRHYCYPSGGYDSMATAVLAKVGLDSATTCNPGLLNSTAQNSRHYLPRFLDGENIHTLEFQAEVSGFSEILRRLVRGRSL